ncbi:MAG: hypothetical protein V3U82_00245 [Robiginitomaculum sp.]
MSDSVNYQRSAKLAQIIAISGAAGIMIMAAWASYLVKGSVLWYVLAPAAFAAACHYFGCAMFVRHFKRLAESEGNNG